jgi:predicted nucleic acid-binding Zn ribbon protein
MADEPVKECEVCGAPVQRMLFPVAIHFKGNGFYSTDYAKRNNLATAGSNGGNGGGSESSGDRSESSSAHADSSSDSAKSASKATSESPAASSAAKES